MLFFFLGEVETSLHLKDVAFSTSCVVHFVAWPREETLKVLKPSLGKVTQNDRQTRCRFTAAATRRREVNNISQAIPERIKSEAQGDYKFIGCPFPRSAVALLVLATESGTQEVEKATTKINKSQVPETRKLLKTFLLHKQVFG